MKITTIRQLIESLEHIEEAHGSNMEVILTSTDIKFNEPYSGGPEMNIRWNIYRVSSIEFGHPEFFKKPCIEISLYFDEELTKFTQEGQEAFENQYKPDNDD